MQDSGCAANLAMDLGKGIDSHVVKQSTWCRRSVLARGGGGTEGLPSDHLRLTGNVKLALSGKGGREGGTGPARFVGVIPLLMLLQWTSSNIPSSASIAWIPLLCCNGNPPISTQSRPTPLPPSHSFASLSPCCFSYLAASSPLSFGFPSSISGLASPWFYSGIYLNPFRVSTHRY